MNDDPDQLGPGQGDHRGALRSPPWLLVQIVIAAVLLGFGLVGIIDVLATAPDGWHVALMFGGLAALLAIQVGYFARPLSELRAPVSRALVGVQVVVVYTMLTVLGDAWAALPGFAAGSALLVLSARAGWLIYGLVVVLAVLRTGSGLAAVTAENSTVGPIVVLYTAIGAAITGLVVFGLTRLAGVIADLNGSRAELAEAAAQEERLTLASDLRRLIGERLTQVVVHADRALGAAHRSGAGSSAAVQGELERILVIARRALTDARSIASRYRTISLATELEATRAVLHRADIASRIDVAGLPDLPAEVETVLAMGVREAATLLMRSGSAELCAISLTRSGDQFRMHVRDGRLPVAIPVGSGDGDAMPDSWITSRVARTGGRVTRWSGVDGPVRMVIEVPIDPTRRPAQAAAGVSTGGDVRRRGGPVAGERSPLPVVVAVFVGFGVIAAFREYSAVVDPVQQLVNVLGIAAIVVLQLVLLRRSRARGAATPGLRLLWFLQLVGMVVPLAVQTSVWVSLPGLVAGTALLVWRPLPGVGLFLGVLALTAGVEMVRGSGVFETVFNVVSVVNSGLTTWGLVLLVWLGRELVVRQAELARTAVMTERLRILRDVHDLLGFNLSAITLKGELGHRLVDRDPGAVIVELVEIRAIAQAAADDLTAVTSGGPDMSISAELAAIRSILQAADVELAVDVGTFALPAGTDEVCAMALREGVTNMLRHSKAEHCAITIEHHGTGEVRMELVNDGVGAVAAPPRPPDAVPVGGAGLVNLRERVAAHGGRMEAAVETGARFRLQVWLTG
jgi:signal transduction histidine kinase